MTYSEALKSWEWKRFRQQYIDFRSENGETMCDDCGFETLGTLRVHHKTYRKGLLPWEYEYADLRLVCKDCHELIHVTEQLCREVIRALPPHVCNEFNDFLTELSVLTPKQIKVALARAKNIVRSL